MNTTTTKHDTREGWLKAAVADLDTQFFAGNGYALPTSLAVSCGFVKGGDKAIGVCFDEKASEDETIEMFICPTQAEPLRVLDILLHEMIHASVGHEAGHRGPFKKLALEFGLSGKMTATVVEPDSDLHRALSLTAERLGEYPHSAMKRAVKKTAHNKWVRYASPNYDDFKVVVNEDRVAEHGAPRDPDGEEMVPVNP